MEKQTKRKYTKKKSTGLCIVPDCLSTFVRGCRTKFHLFPDDVQVRRRWLKSLKLRPKDLYAGARICYLHFDVTCYKNNNPKYPLKPNAVPTAKCNWRYDDNHSHAVSIVEACLKKDDVGVTEFLEEVSSADDDEVEKKESVTKKTARKSTSKIKVDVKIDDKQNTVKMETICVEESEDDEVIYDENVSTQVCRTCLATECKMYSMKQYNLEQTYLQLCGVTSIDITDINMPQMVCYECCRRLQNFVEFKEKTLMAWSCLKQLVEENRLTVDDVKNIDRHQTSLASKFVYTMYEPNYYDTYILEEYQEATSPNYTEELDIQFDTDNYLVDYDTDTDDLLVETDGVNESDGGNDNWEFKNKAYSITKKYLNIDSAKDKSINKKGLDSRYSAKDKSLTKRGLGIKYSAKDKSITNKDLSVKHSAKDKSKTKRGLGVKKAKKRRKRTKSTEKVERPNTTLIALQEIFEVTTMTPEEQRLEVQNRKKSINYINSKYKCDKCYRGFQLVKSFFDHMKKHSDESGEFVCDLCQTHHRTRNNLQYHIGNAHIRFFACKKCPFYTTFSNTALDHKNYHDGVRFQCALCPRHYAKQSTYVNHVRRVHPEDIICHLCGVSLAVIRELDSHFRTVHKDEDLYLQPPTESSKFGPVQRKQVSEYTAVSYASTLPKSSAFCSTCEIQFLTEKALKQHLSQAPAHGHPPIYQPPASARPKGTYYKNMIKNPPLTYACEECGITLPPAAYAQHFKLEHPAAASEILQSRTRYVCDICGKDYSTALQLKEHLEVHSLGSAYGCELCGRVLPTRAAARAHRFNHGQSKTCSVCGKVFSFASNLYKHMKIHTQNKPYACGTCDKRFITPSDRRTHVLHAHEGVPYPKRRPKDAPRLRRRDFGQAEVIEPELETELMTAKEIVLLIGK